MSFLPSPPLPPPPLSPVSPPPVPPRFGLHVEDPCQRLSSEELCRAAAEAAGFERVEVWRGVMEQRAECGAKAAAKGVWKATVSNAFFPPGMVLAPEQLQQLEEEFLREAEASLARREVAWGGPIVTQVSYFVTCGFRAASA